MDGESTRLSPEQHYQAGMEMLREAHGMGIGTSLEALLAALTHSMLGGLSDGLDYAERQRVSAPKPPEYAPYIEEEGDDSDRP